MKKILLILFVLLCFITGGSLYLFGDRLSLSSLGFSDPWQRRYVNGKEVIYRISNTYENCETIDQILSQTAPKKALISQDRMTRLEYLDTLFRAHCIDITNTDIGENPYLDTNTMNIRSQKLIATAQKYGILRERDDTENTYFYPYKTITKIEALAFLLRFMDVEIKIGSYKNNNFGDVESSWQKEVSDIASHLSLTYVSRAQNRFYPYELMTEGKILRLFEEAFQYYR